MSLAIPPGVLLILGGLLLPLIPGRARHAWILALPLATLWLVWQVPDGVAMGMSLMEYKLELVEGGKLSRLFATVFSIMAFAGGLYAMYQSRTLELAAAFVYAGSAIGVAFAGDLITLFVFWEMMAIGSSLVLWSAGSDSAYRAAKR